MSAPKPYYTTLGEVQVGQQYRLDKLNGWVFMVSSAAFSPTRICEALPMPVAMVTIPLDLAKRLASDAQYVTSGGGQMATSLAERCQVRSLNDGEVYA